MPLSKNASTSAGPASPAAMPVRTKMPAPIIAPTPIIVISISPNVRLRVISSGFCGTAAIGYLQVNTKLSGRAGKIPHCVRNDNWVRLG
jgi:hypothetical protein